MSLKFSMNKHTFENKNMMKELALSDTESDVESCEDDSVVESDIETVDDSGEESLEDGVIESKGETNDDSNAESVSESVSESETDSDESETQNIYDLDYIKNVKEYGFQFTLPEKTLGLINRISRMVGAPSYIKTPIFHRSKHSNPNYKNRDFLLLFFFSNFFIFFFYFFFPLYFWEKNLFQNLCLTSSVCYFFFLQ